MALDVVTYVLCKNYTDSELTLAIEGLSGGMKFKGSVATQSELPLIASNGDLYLISDQKCKAVRYNNSWLIFDIQPTKTSQLTNDSGFLTEHQDISGKADKTALESEVSSRETADTTLQNNITQEVNDRESAINTVNESINQEALTREQADTTLQNNINNKQDKLTAGDGIDITNNTVSIDGDVCIAIYDNRISDANDWLTNGYTKTSAEIPTANLPSVCTENDRWGVLLYVAENNENKAGLQQYFPIDGEYKGRVFYRSVTGWGPGIDPEFGEWELLPWSSEKQNTLVSGTNIKTVGGQSLLGSGNVPASEVSVSATGTSTEEIQYITVDGVEKKIAGSSYESGSAIDISNAKINVKYDNDSIKLNSDGKLYSTSNAKLVTGFTTTTAVGGVPAGTTFAENTSLESIIKQILGQSVPTVNPKIYKGVCNSVPTTQAEIEALTLDQSKTKASILESGYVWRNITTDNQYEVLAVDKASGIRVETIVSSSFELEFTEAEVGDYYLYYGPNPTSLTSVKYTYNFYEE